jgi:hypothetical protein
MSLRGGTFLLVVVVSVAFFVGSFALGGEGVWFEERTRAYRGIEFGMSAEEVLAAILDDPVFEETVFVDRELRVVTVRECFALREEYLRALGVSTLGSRGELARVSCSAAEDGSSFATRVGGSSFSGYGGFFEGRLYQLNFFGTSFEEDQVDALTRQAEMLIDVISLGFGEPVEVFGVDVVGFRPWRSRVVARWGEDERGVAFEVNVVSGASGGEFTVTLIASFMPGVVALGEELRVRRSDAVRVSAGDFVPGSLGGGGDSR